MAIDWGVGPLPEAKAAKWEITRSQGKARFVAKQALIFLAGYLAVFHGVSLFFHPHGPLFGSWFIELTFLAAVGAGGGVGTWNTTELRYGLWKSSQGPLHFP